jgi:2-hydroxycyclohexanecarboxyl-CoA dehydrogenase
VNLSLGGKRVVVFGAASGIGANIARAFVTEGARLIAVDRDPKVLDLLTSNPNPSQESSGIGYVTDVTDFTAVSKLASECSDRNDVPDHIVFAVGAGSGKFGFPFWKLAPSDWDRVLRVNLIGAVNVAHAFAPLMVDSARSESPATPSDRSILMLSSVAGQIGSQTDPPYSAAKAALINFAQCAAKDLAPFAIRVNSVCPGMVRTPLNQGVYEAWAKEQSPDLQLSYETWAAEKIQKVVPLNRWQETEEIAAMSLFLASTHARNITGQTINVDGGFVMHW